MQVQKEAGRQSKDLPFLQQLAPIFSAKKQDKEFSPVASKEYLLTLP